MDEKTMNDLAGISTDELRELIEQRERAEKWQPLTTGLRKLAELVERHPDLTWQRHFRMTLWAPYNDGDQAAWMRDVAEQIGGEWENKDDESFFNLELRLTETVKVELTYAKPMPAEASTDDEHAEKIGDAEAATAEPTDADDEAETLRREQDLRGSNG